MCRPYRPSSHSSLLRLLFVMGVLLWLSPPAIALPPYCLEGERCVACGDGICDYDEWNCPQDCNPEYCGDGICNGVDDCSTCPDDCGACPPPYCGDGVCNGGESCSSCSGDCGFCPDGHATCDGWDRQGACALSFPGVGGGADFRRFRGGGGYSGQTFLTWHPSEFNGFGRFTVSDGSVGTISTSPLPGQVPLYRWSARRGFVYDLNPNLTASDYVYGGIAGYVWPPGSNQGYPLYRTYSHEYGFFYTNYPRDMACQPNVYWQPLVELARVNWPAPFFQATVCYRSVSGPLPPRCDPFAVERCRQIGWFFNFNNCTCNPFP